MSDRIHVLDENVINRIAAGEVVERPASVVKELVENSIDAQASSIQLDIEDGGKKLIRLKDNGHGMSHDDAFLALERHATSKLRSEKELIGIPTMGFRGEALASIASVSRMKLSTKDDIDDLGISILSEGGTLSGYEPVAMNRGTMVEVRNIFFNTPVRRKYLKKASFESAQIHDLFLKVALANPSVGFKLTEDTKTKLEAQPATSFKERVHTLFPSDVFENLVELDYELDGARLSGYVSKPPYTRSSLRYVFSYVNSRPVKDRLVNASLIRAFSNLVEKGRYPFAIIMIQTSPDEVDVNVHPQKAEVRFLRPGSISNLIMGAVNDAIIGRVVDNRHSAGLWSRPTAPMTGVHKYLAGDGPRGGPEPTAIFHQHQHVANTNIAAMSESEIEEPRPRLTELTVIGRLPNSFVVLHDDHNLVILDHHAAHERLIFNQLCDASTETSVVEGQDLLIPHVIELTSLEAETLRENIGVLTIAGFAVEDFGSNSFLVRSIPSWLHGVDLDSMFKDFLDTALETGLRADPEKLRKDLLRSLACKAAVKENSRLSTQEIEDLIRQLENSSGPSDVCPHGRPISVSLSFEELRRRMGRK